MADPPEITPEILVRAYCAGIFPMAESAEDPEIFWVDPEKRGILPLDRFHVSRSLRKRLLSGLYQFSTDRCFEQVVKNCADRAQTWINPEIFQLYKQLHRKGFAHSVEVWRADALIGGLYGVAVGGAFFGESMFSKTTDGSKLALIALVARLNAGGFQLLDTQFSTAHLVTMGGIEISRNTYQEYLETALEIPADFAALASDAPSQELWQLSTQTS
ncbi:MAG: leucyl/phenylalanyl-tRNA--protein transferase [Paracoccaceae bacterium]